MYILKKKYKTINTSMQIIINELNKSLNLVMSIVLENYVIFLDQSALCMGHFFVYILKIKQTCL